MGHAASDERGEAVRRAIADIRERYKSERGSLPSTTLQGEWFGISQQAVSLFDKTGKVGQKLADGVARHLDTTVDGLVWSYLREGEPVRAGDIPNWRRAVDNARGNYFDAGGLRWDLAANVVLPAAPREATAEFAYEVARLVTKWGRVSGTMRKVTLG